MASPVAEHDVDSKLALSQTVHALHTASLVGVHGADMKSLEPHIVHALQT